MPAAASAAATIAAAMSFFFLDCRTVASPVKPTLPETPSTGPPRARQVHIDISDSY
jgi:hypothetical protein